MIEGLLFNRLPAVVNDSHYKISMLLPRRIHMQISATMQLSPTDCVNFGPLLPIGLINHMRIFYNKYSTRRPMYI